jgi:hypothetical protein
MAACYVYCSVSPLTIGILLGAGKNHSGECSQVNHTFRQQQHPGNALFLMFASIQAYFRHMQHISFKTHVHGYDKKVI